MGNRAGEYRINLSGEAAYRSFVPSPLPPSPPLVIDGEMAGLLARANRQLGLLEGASSRIPNVGLFVSLYVRKEALLSSQIEGTQATLEDILDPAVESNANQDVAEVVRYVSAIEHAVNRLKDLPLCGRLLREAHAKLLAEGRGVEKEPGEFRRTQNWIGGAGSTIRTARYVPPNPEDMASAMAGLERYMNEEDEKEGGLDHLIQAALIHYQFETIHPFLDGNGRIGRLLVTLFLIEKGDLSKPVLYLSYYLKRNQVEYYDRMTEVRTKGNYEQWVKFFLRAVEEAAAEAVATIGELTALHDRSAARVAGMGRGARSAARLLAYLEDNPIIEIGRTAKALGMSFNTVSAAVDRLLEAGILAPANGNARGRAFLYEPYLSILRRGT